MSRLTREEGDCGADHRRGDCGCTGSQFSIQIPTIQIILSLSKHLACLHDEITFAD